MFTAQTRRATTALRRHTRVITSTCIVALPFTVALAAPFPAEVDLATLLSTDSGIIANGIVADDQSGYSVAAAGDVNGDGLDDFVIGAQQASPGGVLYAGQAYVVFGQPSGLAPTVELSDLLIENGGSGSNGFVLSGFGPSQMTGTTVSGGADFNADGLDDLVISARLAGFGDGAARGSVYVIYGSSAGFPAEIDLATLFAANGGDGSVGTVFNGADSGDFLGQAKLGGDYNGDGIADLIMGADGADPGGRSRAGEFAVVFGTADPFGAELTLASLLSSQGGDGTRGVVYAGIDAQDRLGAAVANAGDVNGDGIDDMIVSAPDAGSPGNSLLGEAYLIFGRDTPFPAELNLSRLLPGNGGNGSEGVIIYGEAANSSTGSAVSAAGDIDADGFDDFLVGARFIGAGRSYLIYGRAAAFPAVIDLATYTGAPGNNATVFFGEGESAAAGHALAHAGDINNDGIDDLVIGAYLASSNGRRVAGASYLVFGNSVRFGAEVLLGSLRAAAGGDGQAGVIFDGIAAQDGSGFAVASAGDINHDSIDDLLLTAPTADPAGLSSAGQSYVVYGRGAATSDDDDNDGIPNATDNCPLAPNADQLDSDGDLYGDACDNCSAVANANQSDTNNDGYGNICDADFNGDNFVNFTDLSIMGEQFFTFPTSPNWNPDNDLTGDNAVNFSDLNLMRDLFFRPPGPSGLAP